MAGVDNDIRLGKTYTRNNSPSRFFNLDIREVQVHELRATLGLDDSVASLYAACTPCQPFSSLNKAYAKDERKSLLLDFLAIVEEAPPDYIIVENVPGLNNAVGNGIYQQFRKSLEKQGFRVDADRLDAKDFGVPQTRKRFILVASRHGQPSLPSPTSDTNYRTVRDSIARFPVLSHGEQSAGYINHVARRLRPHHLRIVNAIPRDGGSRCDVLDTSILLKCHQKNPRAHKDVFGRMCWDMPSPTLTCRCTDVYCGRFVHPDQDRGISVREAAALQTFHDQYRFFGDSITELSRQIGNAVPVRLAESLGRSFIESQAAN